MKIDKYSDKGVKGRMLSLRKISPSNLKSPFTLIEIIVVIGIMVLLMAVAMPAFSSMMRGAGIDGATRNICQILKLARTYAINNREYTAVLVPNANLSDTYHNRSYRVCIVKREGALGSYTYEFLRWLPGENWSFLPAGTAIFDVATSKVTSEANTFDAAESITSVICEDIGAGSSESLKGIIFRPNGKPTASSNDIYIGIGEGVSSGDELTNTNPNAEPSNIAIGHYTGRITYGTE